MCPKSKNPKYGLSLVYLVKAHLAAIRLGQCLTRDDFEQQHEFESVTEVIVNVVNGGTGLSQMAVAPGCECLRLMMKVREKRKLFVTEVYNRNIVRKRKRNR